MNISSKSQAIRSDIRVARDRLVQEAACDLHALREQRSGPASFTDRTYKELNIPSA